VIPVTRRDRTGLGNGLPPVGHRVCVKVTHKVGECGIAGRSIDRQVKFTIADQESDGIIVGGALRRKGVTEKFQLLLIDVLRSGRDNRTLYSMARGMNRLDVIAVNFAVS
jgi:hypothetical protein